MKDSRYHLREPALQRGMYRHGDSNPGSSPASSPGESVELQGEIGAAPLERPAPDTTEVAVMRFARYSLPDTEPEYQKTRARRGCECAGPCFYCGVPLEGRHDHDHFPVPWRFGGRHVVPACVRCHQLKDIVAFYKWPDSAREAALDGMPKRALWAMAFVVLRLRSGEPEPMFEGDEAAGVLLELVRSCTTSEARVVMAMLGVAALTHDVRLAEELAGGFCGVANG